MKRAPITRREARDSQRWRLLEAVAHEVGQRGYVVANVAHVIERAGVSRKAFYEHFTDKEEAFIAAYEEFAARMVADLVETGEAAGRKGRTVAQLTRYLDVLSRDLTMARAFIVEVMGAGTKSLAARERVNRQFAEVVFSHTSRDPLVRRALVGGINDVVTGALFATPRTRDLGVLLPSLRKFVGC